MHALLPGHELSPLCRGQSVVARAAGVFPADDQIVALEVRVVHDAVPETLIVETEAVPTGQRARHRGRAYRSQRCCTPNCSTGARSDSNGEHRVRVWRAFTARTEAGRAI